MQVIQFIKSHLLSLLCGAVAIAAIAGGVLGMTSDKVIKDMKAEIRRTGASKIRSLRSDPKNDEIIRLERRRGELFENEYARTVEVANRINAREVLMGGVFPQAEKAATPFEFQQLYARTMKNFWTKLDAGTLPTEAEIQEEAQNVEDLLALEAEQKAEEEGDESGRAPSVPLRGRTRAPDPTFTGGRFTMPEMVGGGRDGRVSPRFGGRPGPGVRSSYASSSVNTGEPKYNPTYRARVSKARSIFCYYDEASFHVSPLAYADEPPSPEEMWFAQVGLWVQEDVVKAIAGLNREAADRVTEGDACVEHVPVKRLVLLRVLGYETPRGRVRFLSAGVGDLPPGAEGPSLTGRKCKEQYDVVRFVLSVVIDQRDILQLIDHISRVNFYQCLSASYEAVDHAYETEQGYFYGTDPVVRATLEFEGYLAREVYEQHMPPIVRKMLGIEDEGGDD